MGVMRRGNDTRETMDYEKQTEDFRGEGVGEWDRLVMSNKEGTYCMVHWVLYRTNESSNFTSECGDVLYGD